MKKIILGTAMLAMAASATAQSSEIFNHLGAGVGVGTNGISVELATPVTKFIALRAGVSYMPAITFNANAEFTYQVPSATTSEPVMRSGTVQLQGDLGRVQGQVIFNVYPMPKIPLFVAVGGYFGGNKILKITGHSEELANPDAQAVIGDYKIPADEQGNISGGLKVKGFRPYVGIGWGRSVPNKRVNFACDLGVQIQGKPELYTDYGEIDKSIEEDDNAFNKVRNALTVYPTLTFRINFRAF